MWCWEKRRARRSLEFLREPIHPDFKGSSAIRDRPARGPESLLCSEKQLAPSVMRFLAWCVLVLRSILVRRLANVRSWLANVRSRLVCVRSRLACVRGRLALVRRRISFARLWPSCSSIVRMLNIIWMLNGSIVRPRRGNAVIVRSCGRCVIASRSRRSIVARVRRILCRWRMRNVVGASDIVGSVRVRYSSTIGIHRRIVRHRRVTRPDHTSAVEGRRLGSCGHLRPALVHRRPLAAVGAGHLLMLGLH